MDCHVINLQQHLGGAEVYTIFFTRALLQSGCRVTLHVHPGASHWSGLMAEGHAGLTLVPASDDLTIAARLPTRSWIVTHAPVSESFVDAVSGKHLLTGFCHMPLAGRRAGLLARYDLVFGVSRYVIDTLAPAGITRIYPEPFFGIAEFSRFAAGQSDTLRPGTLYSWDKRKFRDRALSWLDPLRPLFSSDATFARRPGLTLGIVSVLGPIKQFDALFRHVAPAIAARPDVNLEIFGNGGYRSVADLKAALRPLGARVRFWGRQPDPRPLYAHFDYLLSGLPEKEALGLNIIEAQVLGTPVLAVNAPPFVETVADGRTGFLYRDPREDGGIDFARVLDQAIAGPRPNPLDAVDHLARFSQSAFNERIARLIQRIDTLIKEPSP